jgi:hypothetical protein
VGSTTGTPSRVLQRRAVPRHPDTAQDDGIRTVSQKLPPDLGQPVQRPVAARGLVDRHVQRPLGHHPVERAHAAYVSPVAGD